MSIGIGRHTGKCALRLLASCVASSPRLTVVAAAPLAFLVATSPLSAQSAPPPGTPGARTAPAVRPQVQPSPATQPAPAPTGPFGVWLDDTGRGAVEIRPCGENLCGNIVWLQEPLNAKGLPVNDGYNPDATKRSRPVCGMQVIGQVRPQTRNTWDEGWVYDPKVGKLYDVAITQDGNDRLTVTGYKGVKFLSKSFVWTRAPANLGRCDQTLTHITPGAGSPAEGAKAKSVAVPGGAAAPPPARASTTTLPPAPPARQ